MIASEVELQTEMGQKAQEILLRGEAIPQEFAERMLYSKINSPEVGHHGNYMHPRTPELTCVEKF